MDENEDLNEIAFIKRTTAGYTGPVIHNDFHTGLKTYQEFREAFRSTCQLAFLDGTYIDELHFNEINIERIVKLFQSTPITTDRLQTKQIYLNPDVWHEVVESPKEPLTKSLQVVISKNKLFLSELLSITKDGKSALILRVTSFGDEKAVDSAQSTSQVLDTLILNNDLQSLKQINEMSKLYTDFSIHEYFLPYGFDLESAVLLFRYDTSNVRHVNYYGELEEPKKQYELLSEQYIPTIYKIVYSPEIFESHFHFCEGIASIYKLSSNPKRSKFGEGFGISVSELASYLKKINEDKYISKFEETLYANNDFGMPFMHFPLSQRNLIYSQLSNLEKDPHNFLLAYDVFKLISLVQVKEDQAEHKNETQQGNGKDTEEENKDKKNNNSKDKYK